MLLFPRSARLVKDREKKTALAHEMRSPLNTYLLGLTTVFFKLRFLSSRNTFHTTLMRSPNSLDFGLWSIFFFRVFQTVPRDAALACCYRIQTGRMSERGGADSRRLMLLDAKITDYTNLLSEIGSSETCKPKAVLPGS